MDPDILVSVEGVRKKFCRSLKRSLWYGLRDLGGEVFGGNGSHERLRPQEFWAVDDVSFQLRRGECLGLIGRNGAGKTTLLKMLNGLIKPDAGRITLRGRVGALIALGAGFNPILTGRENIYVNGSVLGLSKREIDAKKDEIIEFAEIGEFIDSPVQSYSSGMQVRLGYAVAACLKPEILLVDEVLAVGDAAFQRKCMQSMHDYVKGGGSLVLVAHNMHAIMSICDRCAVLDHGRLGFLGTTTDGIKSYYSLQLPRGDRSTPAAARPPTAKEPVVIDRVDVSSADGGPLVTGGAMRIVVHYRALADHQRVDWGFSLWSGDQHVRIGTATASWNSVAAALHEGAGTLEAVIPSLPLLANRYALRAGIYDAEHSWPIARVGWDDPPVPFVVESPAAESFNRQLASGDLIILDVDWKSRSCPPSR
jgi:lipopolysaccharide transport system ATP-binding protein